MRFSTVIVALAASVASASILAERQTAFPDCATPCIVNADYGTCGQTDAACLCKSDAYLSSTTKCIQSSCSAADLATAAGTAQALCKAAGVDISTNPAAQPSGTAAASGAASSAPATTSAAAAASATPTHNAATGTVVAKGMMVGGFVAAAAVLA
ncbi:hypothetical protein FRC00_009760, partial [Tulasnella sp. 408]